jgi:hypothetical protein
VNANRNRNHVAGHNFAAVRHDTFDLRCAGKRFDLFYENQLYASVCKILSEKFGYLGRAKFLIEKVFFRDQRRGDAPHH